MAIRRRSLRSECTAISSCAGASESHLARWTGDAVGDPVHPSPRLCAALASTSPMRARAVILSAVVLVSCSGGVARATAEPTRVITVTMGDFFFSPAVAEVHAGERITFVLKNLGLYEHEFMAGR